MKAHSLFIVFLVSLGLLVPLAIGLRGCDYYTTPVADRPFHSQYEQLKPSGVESHGYGIVGSLLIMTGVAMYSSRKRLSFLRGVGPIRTFLTVHIFLCLLGPSLILYHTTFKFGGLVAVSLWSMLAVVSSGVIGRYLYTQIPKSMQGQELTEGEMAQESEMLRQTLLASSGMSADDLDRLDSLARSRSGRNRSGVLGVLIHALTFDLHRRWQLKVYRQELQRSQGVGTASSPSLPSRPAALRVAQPYGDARTVAASFPPLACDPSPVHHRDVRDPLHSCGGRDRVRLLVGVVT